MYNKTPALFPGLSMGCPCHPRISLVPRPKVGAWPGENLVDIKFGDLGQNAIFFNLVIRSPNKNDITTTA